MAIKLKKVLKREVFALAEGESLGRPADLLVDPEQDRIALVVLSIGAVPELSVVARADAVQSFESDTLALEGIGVVARSGSGGGAAGAADSRSAFQRSAGVEQ